MAPRAIWKGQIKIAELTCPVALYAAASTSDRVSFTTLNRATGNPVRREYVDIETGKPVPKEDQVKGFEVAKGEYIVLTPEEVAATVPESDKTLTVMGFLGCSDVDTAYLDKPYYLAPGAPGAAEAFAVIRDGMRARNAAALARAVLFRRLRTVLIRPQGPGLVANTLNFDYQVRPAQEAFREIPELKIEKEMLELARHIISTKSGSFNPAEFDDRYDAALAELVRAKAEGRPLPAPAPREAPRVVSLLDALRESAQAAGGEGRSARKTRAGGKAKADGRKPAERPAASRRKAS